MGCYLIYNKVTNEIIEKLSVKVDLNVYYVNYDSDFRDNIDGVFISDDIHDLQLYKVIGGEPIKYSYEEIQEIKKYGKILTDGERLNVLLQPSKEEIEKAQTTIEILSLLQEVNAV